jgi:RNA polymerase sigma factor (sigma-70 family)
VPEREILTLRKRYGEGIAVTTDPAESDYLYEIGDLATYAGRRYSQKRNHVNAFLREHGGAVYEPITEENLPAVRAFFDTYRREEEKDSPSAHAEGAAVVRVLEEFFDLSAEGGLLREGDRILGFFVGEVQGDTLYLHIEKATRAVRGAYPYLVQCAAKAYADRVRYENREEDDGDEVDIPVEAPEEALTDRLALRQLLEALPQNDRALIVHRYFQRHTQQVTAEHLGMTQVQVSRRERTILQQLREKLIG